MQHVDSWRALFRCDDLHKARVVATCVAAMEYDVRLHTLAGPVESVDEAHAAIPPFEVLVRRADWAPLAEVLEELIDEQERFDESIEILELRLTRAHRRLLVTMIVVVSVLAIAGAIEV